MFICGDWTGQGRWSSPSYSSNHDRTVPSAWMGALSSWKIASLFGKRLDHGMHLITQPVHVLLCSNSAMKGNNGTNRILQYCCLNHHRTYGPPRPVAEVALPLLWLVSHCALQHSLPCRSFTESIYFQNSPCLHIASFVGNAKRMLNRISARSFLVQTDVEL
jgi:hypothetical protein